MIVLDKIKAFLKWYGKGTGFLEPKPEAKGAEKKAALLIVLLRRCHRSLEEEQVEE